MKRHFKKLTSYFLVIIFVTVNLYRIAVVLKNKFR